ncbi:MAG: GNAT family N-acetyltransferase [Owenweeksia sp.]
MKLEYRKYNSVDIDFEKKFSKYHEMFYDVLSQAYSNYYGRAYHSARIKNGQAVLFIALHKNIVVGASYVKKNNRRGGTAVLKNFRRNGIAEKLVKFSLTEFPNQYSILSTDLPHSYKMLALLSKTGFVCVKTIDEVQLIVGKEFHLLKNFVKTKNRLVFDRVSSTRSIERKKLTLMFHK